MKPISSDWAERHPVSRFKSCSARRFFIWKASAHSAFARYDQLQRDAQKLLLWFSPSDLTRRTFKGLFCAFEIRPSFETVPLGKGGFMGVQ